MEGEVLEESAELRRLPLSTTSVSMLRTFQLLHFGVELVVLGHLEAAANVLMV